MRLNKQLLLRGIAILILVFIAAAMFVIGRGHTVYFDNVACEYDGKVYPAFSRAEVYTGKERVAKITDKPRDNRGMTDTMGQNFSMTVKVVKEEGDKQVTSAVSMRLPYGLDGIVINLPALLNGLPEEVYLSEFIPVQTEEEEEEVIISDEMDLTPGE